MRASTSVRPVLNGRASPCTADRSKSGKSRADVGTAARLIARGAVRRAIARPTTSPEMNVPEPRRLST